VSPAFFVVQSKKADDPRVDNLKRYFERNWILPRHKTMYELMHESEQHFSFRHVVDFRELEKRVIPDLYPFRHVVDFSFRFLRL